MAGNSLPRRWWWIPIAVLSGCILLSSGNRVSYVSIPWEGVRESFGKGGAEVVVFLRERCDRAINVTQIENALDRSIASGLSLTVMPRSATCEARSWGLGALIHVLGQTTTKALIAALDSSTCEVAAKLAHLWNKPLLTWTCPLKDLEERRETPSIVRLSPSLPSLAQALAEMFLHLQWKTVAIIGTDDEPWSSLDKAMVGAFRSVGIVPRYHCILPHRAGADQIRRNLRALQSVSHRATVLCLPALGETVRRVLKELDILRQAQTVSSVILIIHTEDSDVFVSSYDGTSSTAASASASPATLSSNFSTSSVGPAHSPINGTIKGPDKRKEERDKGMDGLARRSRTFTPPANLTTSTLENLLAVVPHDRKYDVQRIYNGSDDYVSPTLLDRLNESLNVLTRDNSSINSYGNKLYTYALLDWRTDGWIPIMLVVEEEDQLIVEKLTANAVAFLNLESLDVDVPSCDDDEESGDACSGVLPDPMPFRTTHIVAIILGSLLFTFVTIAAAILIRRHLLKKRMSKGPYKIILTSTDFVFPQVPQVDSRTVDEGIEAMLCCWLQQLQEFGGPEVEKPDLLQLGSVSSLKPYLQASTGNLARHTCFKDPRARYKGDLVQLKEIPYQGTFELKSKALDTLATIHGLRHENLNPLIGCLNEPTRPCLVSEYCSRGSLEDVLVQDEIKLDWSFRLSLLTDLVRGMRYLHGTPIRVHGYLTSRNCVIDARWVLKVTDYGLPAFYEAQNITPPPKMARDLLWTAPELLRHANLRKKGTQPGDVYSFGIIMQEVVVRGEPFCMLALSPEDIIEKVMSPPPLIRPSVSKGAAPPEAINIMRQCWAESADMRPDFDDVHDLFKKLNHGRKVNFVDTMFQMLEKYSNNLEELIRERTEQLDMEKKKTEQLLNRMLPSSVAEKLKLGMPVDPEEFREVTIYFSDIVGFTTISAYSTPFQVVDLLNDLYTCFDATINAYTVYKVETIGDAYMVVGGCPVRIPDHASQIATMALDLLHQSGKFKLRHLPNTQLRLRIGLHTGPCCAGVVGLTMPRYCLFGDTVNTASRMESTGAPWRIHLSQATRDRLTQVGGYYIEYRGPTDVKGKGKMPTYWLLGKQGFDKELPTPPPLGENHGLDENQIDFMTKSDGGSSGEEREEREELERTASSDQPPPEDAVDPPGPQEAHVDEEPRKLSENSLSARNGEGASTGDADGAGAGGSEIPVNVQPAAAAAPVEAVGRVGGQRVVDSRRKVPVSVHEGRGFVQSQSLKTGAEFADILAPRCSKYLLESKRAEAGSEAGSGSGLVTKSASGDQAPLGTPPAVPMAECISCPLGSSTSSLTSITSSTVPLPFRIGTAGAASIGGPLGRHRGRLAGCIDENDLSTPYNHYRCLSPNEHHGKSSGCRLLKRQFSLDRADEPASTSSGSGEQPSQRSAAARLFKQNSAGAANDLERIEEVPGTPGTPLPHLMQNYRHAASVSLSVESLSLH